MTCKCGHGKELHCSTCSTCLAQDSDGRFCRCMALNVAAIERSALLERRSKRVRRVAHPEVKR